MNIIILYIYAFGFILLDLKFCPILSLSILILSFISLFLKFLNITDHLYYHITDLVGSIDY